MTGAVSGVWPTAELDPVRRLKVITSGYSRPVYAERYFDVPVDAVWSVASDLENELPKVVRGVRSFAVPDEARSGTERFSATAVSRLGHRERFDVVLRPGWCLMQSRMVIGGMAASEEGTGTRFALLCNFRFPGGALLPQLPFLRVRARSEAMLDRLEQRISARAAA